MSTATGVPDLLRRFTATTYSFGAVYGAAVITFETNDQVLLSAFRTRAEQLAGLLVSSQKPWHWKVVRDFDVSQDDGEIFLLGGQSLSTIFMGTGTVVAIDWTQGELLGFVAANISDHQLLDAIIAIGKQHHLKYECEPCSIATQPDIM